MQDKERLEATLACRRFDFFAPNAYPKRGDLWRKHGRVEMTEFLRSFAVRERWMGALRSSVFRWTIAGILIFFVFIKIALPLFVSTAIVKDNMEAALSRWTGARATISGAASISFWPGPTLTLSDVRFDTQDGTL